ncbi:MAG: hypothetical protein ACTSWW_00205 [Promethearchaeota archaeon]
MAAEKKCIVCKGTAFRQVTDEWMKRTFRFVEKGTLTMCDGCGAKYLVCPKCGGLLTRVHPALEKWEVEDTCASCGYVDSDIKAWDGVSAR